MTALVAHGGTVGAIAELSLAVVGFAVLGVVIWRHRRDPLRRRRRWYGE